MLAGSAEVHAPTIFTLSYAKSLNINLVDPPLRYNRVDLLKGDHGPFEAGAVTKFFVNPKAGKIIGDLAKPLVNANVGYSFTDWDKADMLPITESIAVTAMYSKLPDVIPSNGFVTANKVWKDAPKDKPVIWFKLYRHIEGGKLEAVPGAEIKKLDGITSVTWNNFKRD